MIAKILKIRKKSKQEKKADALKFPSKIILKYFAIKCVSFVLEYFSDCSLAVTTHTLKRVCILKNLRKK